MVDQISATPPGYSPAPGGASTSRTSIQAAFGAENVPPAGSLPVDESDLQATILAVFTARGTALDDMTYQQVNELSKYTREMDNANAAQSAVQAAAGSTGGGSATFTYTDPQTGATQTMTVSAYVEMKGDSISGKESNSDIETTLNDIGTEAQGMSEQWSTDVSSTMSKDNQAWEAGSDLVSSLNQALNQLVNNLK